MSKLYVYQGLPGSGKSTASQDYLIDYPDTVVVNKDSIRQQLREDAGWEWSREGEKMVVEIRDAKIRLALAAGKNVISDDTNFRKHVNRLKRLAEEAGAEFEVKRFDVTLGECMRRNGERSGDAVVPAQAILEMYNKFVVNDPEHYPLSAPAREGPVSEKVEYVEGLPDAIICDLDGTLALHNGRGPFDYARCDTDLPNWPVLRVLEAMETHYDIIFMSGREDSCKEKSLQWLEDHGMGGHPLFMRQTGDRRKDVIVKRELFDANVRGKWNVLMVLDDRDQVVQGWREMRLQCWQVAPGNF